MTKQEINLLPEDAQKKRRARHYFVSFGRFVQRMCVILAVVLVGEAGLFFMYQRIDNQLEQAYNQASPGLEKVDEEVEMVNEVIARIQRERQHVVAWSTRVEDVLLRIPDGISVVSLTADEEGTLVLVGASGSRSQVLALEEALHTIEWVEQVDAPLQNFALDPGAEFTFTLYENANAQK